MKRVWLLAALWLSLIAPVAAQARDAVILGTIPPYPGASRPLPTWETERLAIALTRDKPEAVIAYYVDRLTAAGWHPADGSEGAAYAAAMAEQPAWLTFERHGLGRLDIQISRGRHPKTGEWLTLIFYESRYRL